MDFIRVRSSASVAQERIKGKGKGKEILYRYEGEVLDNGIWTTQNSEYMQTHSGPQNTPDDLVMQVIDGVQWLREKKPVPKDPRKRGEASPRHRTEFHVVQYQHDENSTGPPPPAAVLVTNLSPLTPNPQIRLHFSQYGRVTAFEPQIDKEKGGALGIVFIRFDTHENAKTCAERENGGKGPLHSGISGSSLSEHQEIRVVLDGEGLKLKAVLKELEERRKREREDKRRKELAFTNVPHSKTPSSQTPVTPSSLLPKLPQGLPSRPHFHPLPQTPQIPRSPTDPTHELAAVPMQPRSRRPSQPQVKSRYETWKAVPMRSDRRLPSSSSTPSHVIPPYKHRPGSEVGKPPSPSNAHSRSPSRSPSRSSRRRSDLDNSELSKLVINNGLTPLGRRQSRSDLAHSEVLRLLADNGKDHIKVDGDRQVLELISEGEVRRFFDGFRVDKVLQSHAGLFVTFETDDSARRASLVLANRQLGYQDVTLSVHSPPPHASPSPRRVWTEAELVEEAHNLIIKELRASLEGDIKEKLIGTDLRKIIALSKMKGASNQESNSTEHKPSVERRGLHGLSFKKKTPKPMESIQTADLPPPVVVNDTPEEEFAPETPRKKRRKEQTVTLPAPEPEAPTTPIIPASPKRRLDTVDDEEHDLPKKKKAKIQTKEVVTLQRKSSMKETPVESAVLPEDHFTVPKVAIITPESSLSPSRSPSLSPAPISHSQPPLSPVPPGICDDDEDAYFTKLVLSNQEPEPVLLHEASLPAPTRKHLTGSARTEGFYKITHAEKAGYVTQYQSRGTNVAVRDPTDDTQQQHHTSSRSNRANARRRAQGLEEINQVQRAVALSKGETAVNELTFKFNQLQTRKKHVRFARSPIHDWGLYAMEKIARGEMVIEYVGEIIRAQVAERREKNYERQGIGSSYLFRIDEDLVVDATKKGNLGRLINHSCDPNCTAKIITINGEKKIVIYAKQDIELGDEITYDYHFPIEQDKIPCLCGSAKCRGYLN